MSVGVAGHTYAASLLNAAWKPALRNSYRTTSGTLMSWVAAWKALLKKLRPEAKAQGCWQSVEHTGPSSHYLFAPRFNTHKIVQGLLVYTKLVFVHRASADQRLSCARQAL